ncbi:hypothetical protein D3C73_1206460 [compost metagenome]
MRHLPARCICGTNRSGIDAVSSLVDLQSLNDSLHILCTLRISCATLNTVIRHDCNCREDANNDDHDQEFNDREASLLFVNAHHANDYYTTAILNATT